MKFCNDFEVYMRERGNAGTTLHNRFRTLRAVLNKAISEGVAKAEHHPFARTVSDKHKYSISKFDITTQKRAISRDEVRKVETFVPVGTATGAYAEVKNNAEVEQYIRVNRHLPGVPSAAEVVEHGVDVAKMDAKLLEKIEELTLYNIQLDKDNQCQQAVLQQQQAEINELKKLVNQLLQRK